MREINFESFSPVYGRAIYFPPKTVIYRSYDTAYDPVSDYPSFFGSRTTASGYLEKGRELGAFYSDKSLCLYDIRFMKVLLQRIITNFDNFDRNVLKCIKTLCLSFGMIAYAKQIELLEERYDPKLKDIQARISNMKLWQKKLSSTKGFNPLQPDGVRVAETTNDAESVAILKQIFHKHIDGIIAPRLFSPFHYENQNQLAPEIVIFNPKHTGLIKLSSLPAFTEIETYPIDLYLTDNGYELHEYKYEQAHMKTKVYTGAGKIVKVHDRNKFFEKIQKGNKVAKRLYERAVQSGKLIKENSGFKNKMILHDVL